MEFLQNLIKFLAGGSIIVGVTWLAGQVNPRYGAILAAAPIITTIAFLFTYGEAGLSTTRQLVLGTFFFAIPSVIFLVSLYLFSSRFSMLESLTGAYGVWFACVLVVSRFIPGI